MSKRQLKKITANDIERSDNPPPKDTNTDAKVVSVHDGDTCDLVIIRNGALERFKCRLADIDAPELDSGRKALKSRDFLAWLSIGEDPESFPRRNQPLTKDELQQQLDDNQTLVYVEFGGTGRYKRPLIILKHDSSAVDSFNDLLVENGYAEEYRK